MGSLNRVERFFTHFRCLFTVGEHQVYFKCTTKNTHYKTTVPILYLFMVYTYSSHCPWFLEFHLTEVWIINKHQCHHFQGNLQNQVQTMKAKHVIKCTGQGWQVRDILFHRLALAAVITMLDNIQMKPEPKMYLQS